MKFSNRIKNVDGNAVREIFELLKEDEIISFAGGWPATETLPDKQIDVILQTLFAKYGVSECLQYDSTRGKTILIEALRKYLSEYKGVTAEDDNIIVTAGGQQGIEYMCKTFLDPGDRVLVQDPTYIAVLQIIKSYEGKPVGVASCEDGIDLADLEAKIVETKPKFLYIVPMFSNPTGARLSANNRLAIEEITAKHGVMVLEDDPYGGLGFDDGVKEQRPGKLPPNVVYVTSMSKIIAPALRIGVAVGSREIIDKFIVAKQSTDVCPPAITQLVTAEFLDNYLAEHLARIKPIYKAKRDAMVSALQKYMPPTFQFEVQKGGMFVWGRFTDKKDTGAMFRRAVEAKVAYLPGAHFFADSKSVEAQRTMRLSYSSVTLEEIECGVKALGELFS